MSQGDGDRREKSARLIANALAMTGRFLPLLCGFTVVLVISGCTGRPASDPLRRIDMLERAEVSVPEILTARIPEILAGLRKETGNEDR
jgi:hypothetical protein